MVGVVINPVLGLADGLNSLAQTILVQTSDARLRPQIRPPRTFDCVLPMELEQLTAERLGIDQGLRQGLVQELGGGGGGGDPPSTLQNGLLAPQVSLTRPHTLSINPLPLHLTPPPTHHHSPPPLVLPCAVGLASPHGPESPCGAGAGTGHGESQATWGRGRFRGVPVPRPPLHDPPLARAARPQLHVRKRNLQPSPSPQKIQGV